MPVTFNTSLDDLKNFEYVPQIPMEALFKNLGFKQSKYDQGFQQAQANANSLKIEAYGPDAQRVEELNQEFNEQLQKFSGANFSDPQVLNQFNSYVNTLKNSRELANIQARTNAYKKESARKDEFEKEGIELGPENDGTLSMQEYYGSGKYDPNVRFTGRVYKPYDFSKMGDEVFKAVSANKDIDFGNLYNVEVEKKAASELSNGYRYALENNPQAMGQLRRRFEATYSPESFNNVTLKNIIQKEEVAKARMAQALSNPDQEIGRAEYQKAEDELRQILHLKNSDLTPSAVKSAEWNNFVNDHVNDYARTRLYIQKTNAKDNPYAVIGTKATADQRTHAINNAVDQGTLELDANMKKLVPAGGEGNIVAAKPTKQSYKMSNGQEIDYSETLDKVRNGDQSTMKFFINSEKAAFNVPSSSPYTLVPMKDKSVNVYIFDDIDDQSKFERGLSKTGKVPPHYMDDTQNGIEYIKRKVTPTDIENVMLNQNNKRSRDINKSLQKPGQPTAPDSTGASKPNMG